MKINELICDKRTLHEVTLMAIKNRLIGIQVNNRLKEGKIRKELGEQLLLYEQLDGVNSEGWKRVNEDILTLNDRDLKRRAGKYREFFEQNNEKPTSIFYRLGKEKNGDDDTAQIRENDGKVFESNSRREEHISKFYENLYKKRIDNIMGIEDFLANGDVGNVAVEGNKIDYCGIRWSRGRSNTWGINGCIE